MNPQKLAMPLMSGAYELPERSLAMERNYLSRLLYGFTILCFVSLFVFVSDVNAFLDDFSSGKLGDAWKKSPAGLDASWKVDKGELSFNGSGGHSQMMTGEANWKDYTVDCDVKLANLQEWPGGIRTYVDPNTGGHYAVWVYPVQKFIKLYSGTAWDINTGLVALGEFNGFDPKADTYFHLKVVHSGKNIEVWFGDKKDTAKKIISASDSKFTSGLFACDGWDKPITFDNVLITGPGIPRSQGESPVDPSDSLPTLWGGLKRSN